MLVKTIARFGSAAAVASLVLAASSLSARADGEQSEPGQTEESSGGGNVFKNLFGGGSGTETKVTTTGGPDINQATQEAYDGPKARIAVSRFTDKTGTGWYQGGIGDGMADQMTTALFNTDRYIVLERQLLSDVLQEQDLGASGRVKQATAAAIGEIEGAELLITGAVTEFKGKAAGGGANVGGRLFGGAGLLLGALATSQSEAHMAIDIRVIDTRTSRIVAATSVEGKATDSNFGAALMGGSGGGSLGGGLGAWKNTPIEKALRQCIKAAVAFVVSKTPKVYYRHGAAVQQAAATAPAPTVPAPTVPAPTVPAPGVTAPAPAPVAQPVRTVPDYMPGMVARVTSSRLNVRQGPATNHPVVYALGQGALLLVLERRKNWIQVRDQNQRVGWTAAWLTFPDTSVSPEIFEPKPAASVAAPAKPQAAPAAPPAAQPVAKSSAKDDPIARLKRLKDLYRQELITEDEYKAMRALILEDL